MPDASELRPPLVTGDKTIGDVTRDICAPMDGKPTGLWWGAFALSFTALVIGGAAVCYQIATGIGTWGLNKTVGWAFDITNFVFWIGIGHAGTLISAVLFLFRQKWRTAVNRSAEAMTLFAVICAGIFPVIHMGRPWLAFWLLPYPNTRGPLWVNFNSPLLWDMFAISTYFIISAVFFYVGLLPDLATVRDRGRPGWRTRLARLCSLGWNGSERTWHRHETVYLLLAGLATPLVFSVHSIVSMDFATSVIPGWHTTVFPPYFVAGAIFSGLAMVLTLMIIARKVMRLENYITVPHIDMMCKLMLAMGCLVGLAYATEFFIASYSGNPYEQFVFINRALGPMSWAFLLMIACNVLMPQLLWFRSVRQNIKIVFILSILINVGMWFERFVIIVTSLHRDFLPSSWAHYTPTLIEVATLIGSFGLFFTCFLLFCRFIPVIAMAEVKGVMKVKRRKAEDAVPQAESSTSDHTLLAKFDQGEDLLKATAEVRQRGYRIIDVFSPHAIHGLDRAMGLKPSRLTWVCFICGMTGALGMLWFQHWTAAVNWPIDVGGKPWNSLPAQVPPAFETAVLLAGLGCVFAMFAASRLFPGKRPRIIDPRVSDDRFVLVIDRSDPEFNTAAVREILDEFHVLGVEEKVKSAGDAPQ